MLSSFYYFVDDWVIHSGGKCDDGFQQHDIDYDVENIEDCVKFCESGIGRPLPLPYFL